MSLVATVGQTFVYEFTCTRRVNDVEELYDPTTVKCSFLHANGSEDTLVYAGSDTGDDVLVRLSIGSYIANYTPTTIERLRLRVQTTDTIGAHTWPGKSRDEIVDVHADPHQYIDIPAVTP
jgi:hypothetical protein